MNSGWSEMKYIYISVYVCSIFRFVPYAYLFIYIFVYIAFVICVILFSNCLSYKFLKLVWKNISKGIAIVHIGPFSTCLHHKKNLKKRLVSSVHHWLFIGKCPPSLDILWFYKIFWTTTEVFTHRSHTSTQPASFFVPRNRTYSVLYIVGVRRSRGWEWRWLHIGFRSDVSTHFW